MVFITFFDDMGDPSKSYGPFWGISFTDGIYAILHEPDEPTQLARFDGEYWRVLDELATGGKFSEFIVTSAKWHR